MEKLSRRSFLLGSALVGAGLGANVLAGCSSSPAAGSSQPASDNPAADAPAAKGAGSERTWDRETDVLVCGFGAAGAACAIEAATNGAEVLLVEKGSLPGGSMCRSGGGMAGAGTTMQKDAGIEDSADAFYDWIMLATDGLCPSDIARVYADNSAANLDWLDELCVKETGEHLFLSELTDDTARIGINRRGVPFASFGLTEDEVVPRSHWAVMKEGSTASNAGPELFYPLLLTVEGSDKIAVEYETALSSLITDEEGAVLGAVIKKGNAEETVRARNGVMLATGGFPNSEEMRKNFCFDTMGRISYMNPLCTGDGVKAAMAVGADLANTCQSYIMPDETSYTATFNEEWEDIFPMWLQAPDDPNKLVAEAPIIAETHGGVVIDTDSRVLDVWGQPIPNLYAAGCDVGSNIFGKSGNYPGCGSYVGFAICFGRIAGENLAGAVQPEGDK